MPYADPRKRRFLTFRKRKRHMFVGRRLGKSWSFDLNFIAFVDRAAKLRKMKGGRWIEEIIMNYLPEDEYQEALDVLERDLEKVMPEAERMVAEYLGEVPKEPEPEPVDPDKLDEEHDPFA